MPCQLSQLGQFLAATNLSPGQRRGGMLYGLALAVLSRSQGTIDYTLPANLKAAAQQLASQPEYGLEWMDTSIAFNEIIAQQNAGGMIVGIPDPVSAAQVATTLSYLMSPAELSASETLLRCLLTQ